jgi:hypothetical protein
MARLPAGYTIDLTGTLVPIAPANPRELTKRRFMGRLSLEEQVALTYVRDNSDTDPILRAQLTTLKELRDMADVVNLDDPDTMPGQQLALAVLAGLPEGTPGRIEADDIPARLASWRADFPQPGEST